jgi:hypothetical protein
MMMPPLLGILDQPNFFIYAACDVDYFNDFGPALINSAYRQNLFGGVGRAGRRHNRRGGGGLH